MGLGLCACPLGTLLSPWHTCCTAAAAYVRLLCMLMYQLQSTSGICVCLRKGTVCWEEIGCDLQDCWVTLPDRPDSVLHACHSHQWTNC